MRIELKQKKKRRKKYSKKRTKAEILCLMRVIERRNVYIDAKKKGEKVHESKKKMHIQQ